MFTLSPGSLSAPLKTYGKGVAIRPFMVQWLSQVSAAAVGAASPAETGNAVAGLVRGGVPCREEVPLFHFTGTIREKKGKSYTQE